MKQKSVKQRVFEILELAMKDNLYRQFGYILYAHQRINCVNGWVSQSAFANPTITKSTCGKRRLRELRADPELQAKYTFEKKHERNRYYYRIMPRKQHEVKQPYKANRLQLAGV